MIKVVGGNKQQKEITTHVVEWCVEHLRLIDVVSVLVKVQPYKNCWGECEQVNDHSYNMTIVHEQPMRDFVATIVHEMVHVMQWETDDWVGDGEAECNRMQYMLTDELWKKGVL